MVDKFSGVWSKKQEEYWQRTNDGTSGKKLPLTERKLCGREKHQMYGVPTPYVLQNYKHTLHYGEVEKNGWKWSTLRAFFSAVCSENTCKKLLNAVLTPQESMKNLVLKKLKQKMVKKAKKPVAHVC